MSYVEIHETTYLRETGGHTPHAHIGQPIANERAATGQQTRAIRGKNRLNARPLILSSLSNKGQHPTPTPEPFPDEPASALLDLFPEESTGGCINYATLTNRVVGCT